MNYVCKFVPKIRLVIERKHNEAYRTSLGRRDKSGVVAELGLRHANPYRYLLRPKFVFYRTSDLPTWFDFVKISRLSFGLYSHSCKLSLNHSMTAGRF